MNHQKKNHETRQYWDQKAGAFDHEPDHGLRDRVVRGAWTNLIVDSLPTSPGKVLDIGCGTGSLSVVLAELGYAVIGIDLSEKMLSLARAKSKASGLTIPFIVMDAFDPQFAAHQFHSIVCRHLLWALPDPALALQRWSGLLVPGGRLVLIEGFWNTGVGIRPGRIIEALPSRFTTVHVKNLSRQSDLWGREVTDERYMITADLEGR